MTNQIFYRILAEAAAETASPGGSMLGMFLPLIIVFGLMYFLTIRPQKKRDEALRKQISAMQVGDEVVTIGGIVGRVFNISGDDVTISTSVQNTLMTFKISAIAQVKSENAKQEAVPKVEDGGSTEDENKKKGLLSRLRSKDDPDVE